MSTISLFGWLQGLARRSARSGSTSSPAPPARELRTRPGAEGTPVRDSVEISSQGRRLQVEAQVRNAVVGELRRMASRSPGRSEEAP